MKISGTMMKRGHLKETAKVSRYLVAAGHTDFKECMAGRLPSAALHTGALDRFCNRRQNLRLPFQTSCAIPWCDDDPG